MRNNQGSLKSTLIESWLQPFSFTNHGITNDLLHLFPIFSPLWLIRSLASSSAPAVANDLCQSAGKINSSFFLFHHYRHHDHQEESAAAAAISFALEIERFGIAEAQWGNYLLDYVLQLLHTFLSLLYVCTNEKRAFSTKMSRIIFSAISIVQWWLLRAKKFKRMHVYWVVVVPGSDLIIYLENRINPRAIQSDKDKIYVPAARQRQNFLKRKINNKEGGQAIRRHAGRAGVRAY